MYFRHAPLAKMCSSARPRRRHRRAGRVRESWRELQEWRPTTSLASRSTGVRESAAERLRLSRGEPQRSPRPRAPRDCGRARRWPARGTCSSSSRRAKMSRTRELIQRPRNAKTEAVVPFTGGGPEDIARPEVLGIEAPAAAAQLRPTGVAVILPARPLPHVPDHVRQTRPVRVVRPHRARSLVSRAAGVASGLSSLWQKSINRSRPEVDGVA